MTRAKRRRPSSVIARDMTTFHFAVCCNPQTTSATVIARERRARDVICVCVRPVDG